jgi:4-carboxymuconolactone decarboxylase
LSDDSENYRAGLEVRRRVMGEEFVDEALRNADEFTRPLQDYVTEYCWGVAWTRQGIEPKTRSMWTLAVLAATGKFTELKGHTLGALRNGCTPDEIAQLFLHLATYAGVPTAVEAFRAAKPVIAAFREPGVESAR